MADGKVVISTELDNSGIEKGAKGLVSKIKGTLGGLTKVAATATAAVTAAFGAAAVAITKQAVDAYADYEQLTGGVETLFKGAASKVVQYAEDAFYTVGISANEYMETVTSFSASLISALGGDTAKAADVANMALTDMADNANKMGTPLESIKNAYQGFAKQNYTMLDNLKLGYGGTKTEMQRLLKDAQKLTGVKYNINNLADVYNAIHAIQEEMGIAGTTAKEAEGTISGSAAMMAASWKNVLAAIAGGGDLDRAINNLVYSVSKYFENIVPVVERSLAGIGQLIEKVAPQLVQTVAAALIKAIPSLLNAVYQMIIGLAKGIYEGIVALLSGSTKEVSAQLNSTEDLADNLNGAADGASNLADATEQAGNAAKRALAPFDEITKIGGETADMDMPSFGGIGSTGTESEIVIGGKVTDELTPKISGILQNVFQEIKGFAVRLGDAFAPTVQAWSGAFAEIAPAAMDAASRVGEAFSGMWNGSLAPFGEYIAFDFAPSIANTFSETIAPIFADVMPVLLDEFASDFELATKTASRALGDFKKVLEGVKKVFADMCKSISANWDIYGGDLLQGFSDFKEGIRETFETLYTDIIEPVFGYIGDTFTDLWDNHLSPLWNNIVSFVMSTAENILALWNGCLKPIVDFVVALFAPKIVGATDLIVGAISVAVGLISDTISSILTYLNGIITFITGAFTGDWKKAWEGIKTIFKGIWDGFSGIVKGVVNSIIWAINALIAAIYSAVAGVVNGLGSVVETVGNIIGQDWGFSIPTAPPQIPYLAKGAVLPPNKPFLAMVGDQRHGTNIEAPLATIQEAVEEVLSEYNGNGNEAVLDMLGQILTAILNIDVGDTAIGKAANRYNEKMAIIKGQV